jgi:uncharacterized protein (TIGR03437 family)
LILYASGMGETDPPVPGAMPAPPEPSRTKIPLSIEVGGAAAEVIFSGLLPGAVGLYQILFTVPHDSRSGVVPLRITANNSIGDYRTIVE